jgi:hypothetical protein
MQLATLVGFGVVGYEESKHQDELGEFVAYGIPDYFKIYTIIEMGNDVAKGNPLVKLWELIERRSILSTYPIRCFADDLQLSLNCRAIPDVIEKSVTRLGVDVP